MITWLIGLAISGAFCGVITWQIGLAISGAFCGVITWLIGLAISGAFCGVITWLIGLAISGASPQSAVCKREKQTSHIDDMKYIVHGWHQESK